MDRSKATSPTQQRGDIDQGLMGDKTAGFDPAAAPMETDAEAGAGSSPSALSEARAPKPAVNVNATSHGTAMRPNGKDKEEKSVVNAYLLAIIAIAAAIGVLIVHSLT